MKVDRVELLRVLKKIAPALHSRDLVEALVCFWFDGENVWAYDDTIGLRMPFNVDLAGGLRGELMLGVLDKARSKDVNITPVDGEKEMLISVGNVRLKIVMLEPEQSVWTFPEFPKDEAVVISEALMQSISEVLVSVGDDTSMPQQLGVTFEVQESKINLYTTDSKTISWAWADLPKGYGFDRVVVPKAFCEQFLRNFNHGALLWMNEEYIIAYDNTMQLFGRLIDTPRPVDFREQIDSHFNNTILLSDVPSRLKLAVERVLVIFTGQQNEPAEVWVDEKGWLRLRGETVYGEIRDSMHFDEKHPPISLFVDPKLLKRGLAPDEHTFSKKVKSKHNREKLRLSDTAMVLLGPGNFVHLISSMEK